MSSFFTTSAYDSPVSITEDPHKDQYTQEQGSEVSRRKKKKFRPMTQLSSIPLSQKLRSPSRPKPRPLSDFAKIESVIDSSFIITPEESMFKFNFGDVTPTPPEPRPMLSSSLSPLNRHSDSRRRMHVPLPSSAAIPEKTSLVTSNIKKTIEENKKRGAIIVKESSTPRSSSSHKKPNGKLPAMPLDTEQIILSSHGSPLVQQSKVIVDEDDTLLTPTIHASPDRSMLPSSLQLIQNKKAERIQYMRTRKERQLEREKESSTPRSSSSHKKPNGKLPAMPLDTEQIILSSHGSPLVQQSKVIVDEDDTLLTPTIHASPDRSMLPSSLQLIQNKKAERIQYMRTRKERQLEREKEFSTVKQQCKNLQDSVDLLVAQLSTQKKKYCCCVFFQIFAFLLIAGITVILFLFPPVDWHFDYNFPSIDGDANQVLRTNGQGTLVWDDDDLFMSMEEQLVLTEGADADSLHSHESYALKSQVGSASGIADLDSDGKLKPSRLGLTQTGSLLTLVNGSLVEVLSPDSGDFLLTSDDSTSTGLNWTSYESVLPTKLVGGSTMDASEYHTHDSYYLQKSNFGTSVDGKMIISDSSASAGFRWTQLLGSKGSLMSYDGDELSEVPIGSNGYVLTADDESPSGFQWKEVNQSTLGSSFIPNSVLSQTGSLITQSRAGDIIELPVSTESDHILISNPSDYSGMSWVAASEAFGLGSNLSGAVLLLSKEGEMTQLDVQANNTILIADDSAALGVVWASPLDAIPELTGGASVDAKDYHTHSNLASLMEDGTLYPSQLSLSRSGDIAYVNQDGDLSNFNVGYNSIVSKNIDGELTNISPSIPLADNAILVATTPYGDLEWKNDSYILTPENFSNLQRE
ncbi:hypothetical protein ADUPG1_010892, partial [Aduncisulcus paluster]